MSDIDYKQILNEVLTDNKYLCLATANAGGDPWASPLIYVRIDHEYDFYFISCATSRHCQNISENSRVSFSIFDSRQDLGMAFGVQAHGNAVQLDTIPLEIKNTLLEQVCKVITTRDYHFYKITVDEIYLPDETRWQKDGEIRKLVELR